MSVIFGKQHWIIYPIPAVIIRCFEDSLFYEVEFENYGICNVCLDLLFPFMIKVTEVDASAFE